MYKALAILGILFAIFATLAGAGGGCFGRGKSTPAPTQKPIQNPPAKKVIFGN